MVGFKYDIPDRIPNWIDGAERPAAAGEWLGKHDPVSGDRQSELARSDQLDVDAAINAALGAYSQWKALTPVARGDILRTIALGLRDRADDFARIVHRETGKSLRDASGEVGAAFEMGMFVAGEGRRFYGRTTTSAVPNKTAMVVRAPLGVAGLIIAANTPIANVAWKVFPALLCGNTVVLKAAEDTPATAWAFAALAHELGIPAGVLNIIQGNGEEAGRPLVASDHVPIVSFTGSCRVGQEIGRVAGGRLAKVCLELGGKNPLVVCDDADLARAVTTAALSAFSNAGQRCASGSRLIVFNEVYDRFRDLLLDRMNELRVGPGDDDDLGPVINERQLTKMLEAVASGVERGASLLAGGSRLTPPLRGHGFFMAPTLLEGVSAADPLSTEELFGPVTVLYRVESLDEAIELANDSPYGLTAAIWTRSVHRSMRFVHEVSAGVISVNGATYGSEPHMPFGGLRLSGNGLREAGTEALDVYSDLKTVYINHDPANT